jgi:hypothetical protein
MTSLVYFSYFPIAICKGIEGAWCKDLVSFALIGVLFYAFTPFLFVCLFYAVSIWLLRK